MNDAPNRDPVIMAKLSRSEMAPPLNNESDVAATGEPLSITYAPNQPKPKRFVGPSAARRERRKSTSQFQSRFPKNRV